MKQDMILLHGLFGQLSNWDAVVQEFNDDYNIYIPSLPIYTIAHKDPLNDLVNFLETYIDSHDLKDITLIGNSLGGHIAILYAARHHQQLRHLILTGSSGLYENTTMGSYPKRNSVEYIRERVAYTFHDPAVATPELVTEVLSITTDARKCLNVLRMAKSTQRHYVADLLPQISTPTLLIWGLEDRITPIHVAHEFADMIPDTELVILSECGHAPMMEKPVAFNTALQQYLTK